MDELDLLHDDPDGAPTTPLTPVPAAPLTPVPAATAGSLPGPSPGGSLGGPAAVPPDIGPGSHRRDDGPARPWAWLGAVVGAALVAVVGVVWLIGSAVGGGDRPAPVSAPGTAADTGRSEPPRTTTDPVDTSTPTPPPAPTVTVSLPPAPSASSVVAPPRTPSPTPRATPRTVRVPNVVGDRLRSAARTLEQAGFRVSVVSPGGDDRDNRRVIAQQPAGGLVPAGSTVRLYVGGR